MAGRSGFGGTNIGGSLGDSSGFGSGGGGSGFTDSIFGSCGATWV